MADARCVVQEDVLQVRILESRLTPQCTVEKELQSRLLRNLASYRRVRNTLCAGQNFSNVSSLVSCDTEKVSRELTREKS